MPHADSLSVATSRHDVKIVHRVGIGRSFRVARVQGMFDMPAAHAQELELTAELRLDECADWQIGAIVGASGTGKTSVARHVFGQAWQPGDLAWHDVPLVDDFTAGLSVEQLTHALTSVGLSSAPAWLRPYRVLSTGEQFRAGLARMLSEHSAGVLVVDEYTSVVDRTVAKAVSIALERTARQWPADRRIVVVSCHKDFLAWLQPDWLLDLDSGGFDPKAGGRMSGQRSPYASIVASATRGAAFVVRTI